ncbi:MAG: KpsF/GutQ family sugar-phosphate isomerase [Rhodospirillales bacterium]|nr:KpsF/GutQ family sugar-phosphate isomerase [Alphaproteobacteria bacterium]USO03967.1 MAG: KpsF/GutQ family sugar-phosphate isomerase [Rhodospirillales bacterium]
MRMAAIKKDNHTNADLKMAQRVLQTEVEGLEALAATLDENFPAAVDAIHSMKNERRGRLIVAGIGKSGHVARKIVATLASTGTPSHFVHPGEASHGDLGMVTEADVVLMISNSGENPELSDMIAYTRRFGITLIGMTSRPESALARHSDILLLLPRSPEACPNGLAPTTSTTMMMALGDALAVVLLERMGLTPEQFGVFHPGGKIGQRLVRVAEIMHGLKDLPIVPESATMETALLELTGKNLGCTLVVDGQGALKGIITDGDLKRHMAPDLLQKSVTDVMSANPKTIRHDALAAEALKIMTGVSGQYITSLIVLDENGALTGLIRLQDCLQKGIA